MARLVHPWGCGVAVLNYNQTQSPVALYGLAFVAFTSQTSHLTQWLDQMQIEKKNLLDVGCKRRDCMYFCQLGDDLRPLISETFDLRANRKQKEE